MSAEIRGFDELKVKLEALPLVLRKKYLKGAVKRGGELILQLMRHKAPHDTGQLIESLMVSTKDTDTAEGVAEVGPSVKTAWRARFIEYGVRPHVIEAKHSRALIDMDEGLVFGTNTDHPGISAKPFIRPALDEGQDEAMRIIGDALWAAIEQETRN